MGTHSKFVELELDWMWGLLLNLSGCVGGCQGVCPLTRDGAGGLEWLVGGGFH